MKMHHPILALIAFVALGLCAVWMQMEVVGTGYRVGALSKEQDDLDEQMRLLEIEIAHRDRLEYLEAQATTFQLPLLRPDGKPLVTREP